MIIVFDFAITIWKQISTDNREVFIYKSEKNVDYVQTLSDSHIATLQPVLIACDNTSYPGA